MPPPPHEPTPFISAYKYLCTAWPTGSFVCPVYSVHVANSQRRHTAPSDRYRVVKMRTKRKASYALQLRTTALPAHGRGPQIQAGQRPDLDWNAAVWERRGCDILGARCALGATKTHSLTVARSTQQAAARRAPELKRCPRLAAEQ